MYRFNEYNVVMSDGINLYTYTALPSENRKFPVVFYRNPYCKQEVDPVSILDGHKDLLDNGYAEMYKKNSNIRKNYVTDSFRTLPLSSLSETVFGEKAHDLDESLKHPDRSDLFWDTPLGGCESKNAVRDADIPILLTTSFYDIYTEGIFSILHTVL